MPSNRMQTDAPFDIEQELARWQGLRYAAKADFENVLNQRQNKILGLSQKTGPRSEAYEHAKDDLDRAQREFDRIHTVVHRPLSRLRIPTWVLIGVALVLAILETPVNKFLFDVAIRSSNVGSWLVSFGFALLLLLLAHFAGVSLRHIWSDHRKKLVLGSLLIFVLLTFVLLVLVSILTVARAAFSADTGSLQDMFSSVRSAVASLGLWGTLFNAFGDISALVLATINIGGIFVTMMLAFFTHDSDKDFDAAARAVDRSRSKLKKLTATYITGKDKIIKEFAPNISGIGADYKSANQHVIEMKKRLGRPLDEEEDHLIIDTRDRLAEDSRFGDDIDTKIVAGPDGEMRRAEPSPASEMRRRGPKMVANDRG